MTLLLPLLSHGQQSVDETVEILPPLQQTCATPTPWSDNTYEELRAKLETTLQEKNKSIISLDFKGLQAQVDVAVNHLISQDNLTDEDYKGLLKKNISYLEQLAQLVEKAQETTRTVKEGYVIPLATLTSLKAESDKCQGIESQYSAIFKAVSQLNKDLNEILMMSPTRILAQKEKVSKMLDQVEDGKLKMTVNIATENFNFIQTQINAVTAPFEFDSKSLVATH
jgi:hypothetical protein